MKILELKNKLIQSLRTADECWVAVALMNDDGFEIIQNSLSNECIQHYLVGINLPTSVGVLEKLKGLAESNNITSRVFDSDKVFHPKLYIVRKNDRYTAFIGSANCTNGGLKSNIELSYKIDDNNVCRDLIDNFFRIYFNNASDITDEFLEVYRKIFERRKKRREEDRRDMQKLLKPKRKLAKIAALDFSNHFFKLEHFIAFEPPKPTSYDADQERKEVGNRLLELDKILWPEIQRKGWKIDHHPNPNNWHSTTELAVARSFGVRTLESVWLHYGKEEPELKKYKKLKLENTKQTFINHIRFQVIVHYNDIGVWLVIGKPADSLFDRKHFKDRMNASKSYRQQFYEMIKTLSESYYITANDVSRQVSDFDNPNELLKFTNQDSVSKYFIISKEFFPDDISLSKDNIVTTIIGEFEKLYPIYKAVKHTI